jgi:hypothetical protein
LLRLVDEDGDGTFQAPDEWKVLVDGQRSVNILQHLDVHRDEVFGFADIARGDGMILASVAHPLEGSYILRVDEEPAVVWGTTKDNANSLAFHPARGRWYAVQSFANTVVEILDGRVTRTVAAIPDLPEGQQSVPSALEVDPITGELLVVLFSGQRGGDTAGSGVDFVERSGQVVRVHPGSGAITTVATGINAPVDLAVAPDGTLYVLVVLRAVPRSGRRRRGPGGGRRARGVRAAHGKRGAHLPRDGGGHRAGAGARPAHPRPPPGRRLAAGGRRAGHPGPCHPLRVRHPAPPGTLAGAARAPVMPSSGGGEQ